MKIEEPIKAFSGRVIGYVETDTVTGNKVIKDFYRHILGRYDKRANVTRDFHGHVVYQGDQLYLLLNTK